MHNVDGRQGNSVTAGRVVVVVVEMQNVEVVPNVDDALLSDLSANQSEGTMVEKVLKSGRERRRDGEIGAKVIYD